MSTLLAMSGQQKRPPALQDEEEGAQSEAMLGPRAVSTASVFSSASPLAAAQASKRYNSLLCKAALATAAVIVGFVAASLFFARSPAQKAPAKKTKAKTSAVTGLVLTTEQTCGSEGQECHISKCCWDGGDSGLQCFSKSEYWAVCLRNTTCTKGVQPGETHGTYDQYGTFHLDSWSCEQRGERSQPVCSSYDKEHACPSERCDWFRTGKCLPKCDYFKDKQGCPQTHCAWDGATCALDPCSVPGEDCSSTKCCSSTRSPGGMQCFQKSKEWSSCMEFCDANSTHKGWSCKKEGTRTTIPAPCAWAGKDCSRQQCCGNTGFSCVVKDDTYTGCVQTTQHSTWVDNLVPLPEGWRGTVLGGWRSEYPIAAAAPGSPVAGTSLFCFMAVLPDSQEVALMEVAKTTQQGIFACNASAVFNSATSSAAGWDTGTATLVNTEVFFKVWDQVKEDGRYLKYDWTIKADADCAFLPSRVRDHLWRLKPPAGAPLYIKNTNADADLSNGQFLGAIEILSKKAVMTYFDNEDGCKTTMGGNSGEDGFIKGCLDSLGVGFMHDGELLKPDYAASYCLTAERAAFHPLKDPIVLQNCYNAAMGKGIDWQHNTAPGAPIR
mmetsp:Transcript_24774/g.70512  ORF Transcript_24774/g.70512 Transcript_24774/m.70512 type:complete len:608 (-) Transcript_24774:8-1831(-)